MSKRSTYLSNNRIEFYLTFFDHKEGYEERNINGFWLIKMWDGNKKIWTVNLYSEESYQNYKKARESFEFGENQTLYQEGKETMRRVFNIN